MKQISGNAFVYGKNIDTDQIYPGRYLDLVEPEEIARHCMEGADPSLASKINPGDIIVAGTNFGCGSSREHAVITLLHAKVGAVVAESFGRIFYRNAINLGLPVLVCPDITQNVSTGDELNIDFTEGFVENKSNNHKLQGEGFSDYIMEIIESGGIKPLFKKQYGNKNKD